MNYVNTAYDDVFRTLLNDCSKLILPVINEVFGENYSGTEVIRFYPNEHYLNRQNGEEEKRITDSCFIVQGKKQMKYHFECQSTVDHSMLVRIFEYDSQIALDDSVITKDTLTVQFPETAVLYLRSNSSTPDNMSIRIKTSGGEISYQIPTLKIGQYSADEIFEKGLLFLIPFYIFTHESRFLEYNKGGERLEPLIKDFEKIRCRLDELCESGHLEEFTKCTILDMSGKVLENIAKNYEDVRKGVQRIMVGQVLEYEAKTIKRAGIAEGLEKGRVEGLAEGLEKGLEKGRAEGLAKAKNLVLKLYVMGESADTIADISEIDADIIQTWIDEASN